MSSTAGGCSFCSRLVVLCTLIGHYAQISSGLLSITTVDAQRRLLDPARVTVGNASDLAAEVRCSSNYSLAAKGASNATVIWLYENGTAVSSGLRAFGTTQGDDGILRIYPATVLSGGNGTRFWCLDAESNDKLSVTLVLQRTITFIRTPFQLDHGNTAINHRHDPQMMYDECRRSLPDIPSAEITIVNTTYRMDQETMTFLPIILSYCRVQTERGVIYSTWVGDSDGGLNSPKVFSNWENSYKEPEIIAAVGETLHYNCRPHSNSVTYVVKDERNISSEWTQAVIRNVTPSDGGIYQCLVYYTFRVWKSYAHHDLIGYAIIPYIDESTMKISSPDPQSLIFVLDPDNSKQLVPLHCSVKGNPIPQLQWSRDGKTLDSIQLPTGFNQSAVSVLMINLTEQGPGNHTFWCNATLNPLSGEITPLSSSLTASISILPLLDNIKIIPQSMAYNFRPSSEEDRNAFVLMNCSVRAYPLPPRFEWRHGGNLDNYNVTNVTNYSEKLLASAGMIYWSVLRYPLLKMMNGTNTITCHAYSEQVTVKAQAAITVLVKETPSIAPTRVSTAAYLHSIITPTTPTSDSIDGYIQASSSVALVSLNEDLAPSTLPTNEPLPVTVQPLSTEPQTFTDEPEVPSIAPSSSAKVSTAHPQSIITQTTVTSINGYMASSSAVLGQSEDLASPLPTNEPLPDKRVTVQPLSTVTELLTIESFTDEPVTTGMEDLAAVSTPDNATAPFAIIGVAVGVSLLIIVVVVTIIVILAVASNRRRVEKKLSSRSGTSHKPVNGVQNGVISTHILNTSLGSVDPEGVDGDIHSPISVQAFPAHCRNMHENSDRPFSEEFQVLFIKSPNLPNSQGSRSCNLPKNRYANIHCNDGTRVNLDYISGVDGSNYIHANFIDGYLKKNTYVATQGPLPNTAYDFWRMVWELNSPCIIMLTNVMEKEKMKCYQYWPELADGALTLKDITINPVDVEQLAYYTIRSFKVSRGGVQARLVKQFHYTGWPDFGVPEHPHPIIAFIRHLDNFVRRSKGPDIVHCSAGVGRTGTLITIQSMMKMIEHEKKVDIFNFVLNMRHQRNLMVQTERQYIFIHDALLEVVRIGHTDVFIQNLPACYKVLMGSVSNSTVSRMEEEFNYLNGIENVKESQFKAANREENIPKNRSQAIVPYDKYRVQLQPKLDSVDPADYINASHLDGYRQRQQYILAQGPLAATVDDFWRMVWEQNSHTIVMLSERGKEDCAQYWPNEQKIIQKYGNIYVELIKVTDYGHYTTRQFSIIHINTNEKRAVHQYQYSSWPMKHSPFNPIAFIKLIDAVKGSQKVSGGPVIAHDSTSVGRSGIFCVLSSILEQVHVEGIVDIFFTVRFLRHQQPGLVQTFDQYKFCYDTALKCMDSLDV